MGTIYTELRFGNLLSEFAEKEKKLFAWKATEYSEGKDRLQNFREIANFTGCKPQDVALTYLLKHIQSITMAVRKNNYIWAWETEGGEGIKQRIADARNYLLLLAACMDEEVRLTDEDGEG